MKNQHLKNVLELNLAIVFISTSGVLGRSILFPPEITIWWRCVFASIFIGLFCWYKKYDLRIKSKKDAFTLLISGLLLGGHWVTYFYALHVSSVAIGMLSVFTHPVITTILEPLFFKTKLSKNQLFLAGMILIGISFLTPDMSFENSHTKGVIFGVISALFYSLRNIITKRDIAHYNASKVMFYQMIAVIVFFWPLLIGKDITTTNQWPRILTLALLTTTIGHTLFVNSFKNFTISTASIMSSMSPIYGILLGIIFLNEIPESKTIIGGVLIISTVAITSYRSNRVKKSKS